MLSRSEKCRIWVKMSMPISVQISLTFPPPGIVPGIQCPVCEGTATPSEPSPGPTHREREEVPLQLQGTFIRNPTVTLERR